MIYDFLTQKNFRYERKFLISTLNRYEIESLIKTHPAIFLEVYPQRFINNIYLDSNKMSYYFENIEGNNQRLKVRIRWHGELFGFIKKPVLEFKIKQGDLSCKRGVDLNSFCLDREFSFKALQRLFAESCLPDGIIEFLKPLQPVLLNRYSRKYFESSDHKFRITLDFNMEYYKIYPIINSFIDKIIDDRNTVLELKYHDKYDYFVENITNYFPFRVTKSSKYVSGIKNILVV